MARNISHAQKTIGLAVLAGLLLGAGCAASSEPSAAAPATSDGVDGAADPTRAPGCTPKPGADLPDDNFDDSNCDGIDGDKDHAIFVAATGVDSATGTLGAPVRTLGKAVALATASKKDVYVCNGTYAEAVVVDGAALGIYGGYDCTNAWSRGNDRASVAPVTGIPLTVRNVSTLAIDRIALHAPDALDASASSVAMFVSTSHDVRVTHATITAGRGGDGATPPAPTALGGTAMDGAPGRSLAAATCSRNDSNPPSACLAHGAGGFSLALPPACEQPGGVGGDGGNIRLGIANGAGSAGMPSGVGGATHGSNGQNGARGIDGAAASTGIGTIASGGYVASNGGTDGTDGAPGGGGAGGVGGLSRYPDDVSPFYNAGGGGGQGGNGGCAGLGAKAGGAGGASIGVLLFSSDVSLHNVSVRTSAGGAGGRSVAGARGQFGGIGGAAGLGTRYGANPGNGEAGGNGGTGGDGGNGGAGGGGPSVGVFSNDRQPVLAAVTFNTGSGGKGGSGAGRTDGADGVARDVLVLSDADAGAPDAGMRD